MLLPINLTGGSYKHKATPLSSQRTVNFWPQKQQKENTKSPYILEAFPGLLAFGTVAGGTDRGMFEHRDVLYKVTGTTLYSVASTGVHTSLGTIPGSGRCIFAPIGSNLVVSTGGARYYYNGSTVAVISDGDLEAGNSAAHLNNQIIYDGTGARFAVSDVGDATSINGLNYGTAESEADDISRCYTFNQILYNYGKETIEPWWNSGQGNPPFDRVEGGIVHVGLGAVYSVANDKDSMYFYGNDDQIYALRGSSSAVLEPISTQPMNQEFKKFTTVSDAIGKTVNLDGQWVLIMTFPTQGRTFAYMIAIKEWFELSSGSTMGRWLGNSYAYCYRKHLIADYESGDIYELSDTTYTENGSTIIRFRDTAPLHAGLLDSAKGNYDGKDLEMNRFELILSPGEGLLSGQGSDPEVMIYLSDDGGKTWSTEIRGKVGAMGEFNKRVEWFCLGKFTSRIIRIKVSDPIYWSIHAATSDVEVCI